MKIDKLSRPQIFLLIFFISLIIYSNSLNGDFILDDNFLIVDNELIKHIRTIPLLFSTQAFNQPSNLIIYENTYQYYRPLMTLSFAIDYSIWRLNPIGYHLTNIVIHSFNAFLVFCLIYRLFINFPLALLSSVLFCVHPLHTQAVSYITNRTELLVSFFMLATLLSYFRFTDTKNSLVYCISLFSFILALLSREAGFLACVPFFIIFIGIKSKIPKYQIMLHFISFIGIIGIYMIARFTLLVPLQIIPVSPFPFLSDVVNFLRVLTEYFRLLIFPYPLFILRNIAPVASFNIPEIAQLFFPLIFLAIILSALIKRKKYIPVFAISWFILTLLYLLRFMYKFSGRISLEEQWVYLASMGFFVLLAYLILSIKRRTLMITLSIIIVILYSTLTFINNNHWKNEIDFYRYNLKFVNSDIVLRINFINALRKEGRYGEALKEMNYTLSMNPGNWMAYIALGDLLREMGRFDEAKIVYKSALKIDYFCWQANRRLKLLTEEAGQTFKDEIDPALPLAEAKIVSLIRIGNFAEALEAIEKELLPGASPKFYTLAGITFAKMGMLNKAIDVFNAALKLHPDYPLALYNLAVAYENKQDLRKAAQVRNRINQK